MHAQRVVVAVAAAAGAIGVFLPWTSLSFFGIVSGIAAPGWGAGMLTACLLGLGSALAGHLNESLGVWARGVGILAGLAMGGVPAWLIIRFYSEGVGGLVGVGLYVLLLAGATMVFVPDLIAERSRNDRGSGRPPSPRS
ncbi:MAG: hypothetical protein GEV28_05740 [Actinophytocola sp.]|uniref:hypothetical protein n=1 Tax=Actinophytocola sp. TaxID=1872138 RepID=UPI00132C57B0|nr:hypothetical protein [Actinophytocola sp.]MPZ79914.1 hypothetical protein [Actinophytocola sp.]